MGDGLFEDGSAIRRVTGEAVILAGAGYATLLQVAHPAVGQGVHDHSDFADRPLNRLRGTLTFVYGLAFGTTDEAERVARIVRAMHRKVRGVGYDALDPDLQVWVTATLYHGGLRLYEMALGQLSEEERDELYAQSAVSATALGCPPDRWPATRAEFERYWTDMIHSIEVNDAARDLATSLFAPPNPLIRPATRLQRFLTAGLLPPRLREQYGFAWGPRQQRRFDRLFATLRVVYPRLPRAVRTFPRDAFMWDMRRQIARNRLYRRPSRPGAVRR